MKFEIKQRWSGEVRALEWLRNREYAEAQS